MPVHNRTVPAAIRGERGHRLSVWLKSSSVLAALLLSGCAIPLRPATDPDPSDPAAPSAQVRPLASIAPYTRLRPAGPAPWLEQNRRVGPRVGSEP